MVKRATVQQDAKGGGKTRPPKLKRGIPIEKFAGGRKRAAVKTASAGGNYFASAKEHLKFIHSGCKTLDLALGGGWAKRRVINIVGDKSSGKTLLCIEASANFAEQYPKGKIRYREAEEAFDMPYAEALGMPLDRVDFGDKPLDTVEDLHNDLVAVIEKARGPELYIVDSLDALASEEELESELGKGYMGARKAAGVSEIFRRVNGQASRADVTLIIVSQLRDAIGVMYGSKKKRSGGTALDYYASQVVWLKQLGYLTRTIRGIKRVVGIDVAARCKKNKVALPYREAMFPIQFGFGVDDLSSCIDWLKTVKLEDEVYQDMKPNSYKEFMAECPDDRYREEMARIQAIVEREWYALEAEFVTHRRKYGAPR